MKDYNPAGKKLTYEQHMKALNEYKEKQETATDKPWLCEKCQASAFTLTIKKGEWFRTCKECDYTKTIE